MISFSPPFIDDDVVNEVAAALQSGWITTGKRVKQLEKEAAAFSGVDHMLAVNSATSALMLVLHWFGVGKDDEVIVPAYTYCATALAAMHVGAKVVMVDVEDDFNISAARIEDAITEKTKAVISVDFAGWPCDYDGIKKIIDKKKIKSKFRSRTDTQKKLNRILFVSDAAHSFGAIYKGQKIGAQADITVFSLHAVKNLTTAEGGLICLNMPEAFDNKEIQGTLRLWSLNGQTKDAMTKSTSGEWKYDIVYPGFKINMPDVLAAIGVAQLKKYDWMLQERKRVFQTYTNAFEQFEWAICPPFFKENHSSSFHIYPLRIKNINEKKRDEMIKIISEKDVAVNVHFIPLPMLTVFKNLGHTISDYPQTYLQYSNEISLPIYPQLSLAQCETVVSAVVQAVSNFV